MFDLGVFAYRKSALISEDKIFSTTRRLGEKAILQGGLYIAFRKAGRWAASRGPTVIVHPGNSSSTSPAIAAA